MKRILLFLFLATAITACDKSAIEKPAQDKLPVTEAVKTGDWMVTYFINNASTDIGLTFLKFNADGTLTATIDFVNFNGTWQETNKEGNNTLAINITTTETKLQKVNRTWKVISITEYFIDLKDPAAGSNITAQLMKH